jgi:Carboxypeptidase regulatory-like domain
MKVLQVLVLILGLTVFSNAQECGYTFLKIYLKDNEGKSIKTAEIKTLGKDLNKEDFLHYPKNEISYDKLRKNISWSEAEQAYFGSEGMCGGHREVGLRISATGFETFDKIIDLPLGWTTFSIKLNRKGTNETAKAERWTHFSGKVFDENQAVIPFVDLVIINKSGMRFEVKSDDNGYFDFDLPIGTYVVRVSKPGFKNLNVINFQIENSETIFLDLMLKVRGCDDCGGDILGKNNAERKNEIILDYQIIKKRKNNKQ